MSEQNGYGCCPACGGDDTFIMCGSCNGDYIGGDGGYERFKNSERDLQQKLSDARAALRDAGQALLSASRVLVDFNEDAALATHGASILARQALATPAPEAVPAPVCATCNDTHQMTLGDRDVMCTHCPRPCQECRSGGNGPYCEWANCECECHARVAPPSPIEVGRDAVMFWRDAGRESAFAECKRIGEEYSACDRDEECPHPSCNVVFAILDAIETAAARARKAAGK